jgi:methionyl-tRNA formyltransferase
MRAVFYGTPTEAVPALRALAGVAQIALVVTRPDRPRGRSLRLGPSAVKEAALACGWPVSQPSRAADDIDLLRELAPDVAVVVAYGQLIPPELLAVPRAGFVNVHFSILPRWRGAAPVVRAVLAGDSTTGVTLMAIDEGLDTGPIVASAETTIETEETGGELTSRLAAMGAALLAERLDSFVAGDAPAVPQSSAGVSAASRVKVAEAFVDPVTLTAEGVTRAVRAFNPRPGAWSEFEGGRMKLWRARAWAGPVPAPGVVEALGEAVVLGVRGGGVELVELQPAGRSRMEALAWMRGRRLMPTRFTRSG